MKIKPFPLDPGSYPISRGNYLVLDTKYGPVAQKWPEPRGPASTPYDFFRHTEFGIVARFCSNPFYLDLATAVEMTKNTEFVPRDFLMRCAYGRQYLIQNPDGTYWENFRDVSNNPQYVLEQLGSTVGSMIYRAGVGWVLLNPGNAGEVLTMSSGLPTWAPNSGGGGGAPSTTTLELTSTWNPGSIAKKTVPWSGPMFDDNNIWDAANPTRLYIPPAATRIRLSYSIVTSTNASATTWISYMESDTAVIDFAGNPRTYRTSNGLNSMRRVFTSTAPWVENPGYDYLTCSLQTETAQSFAISAGSTVSIECIY